MEWATHCPECARSYSDNRGRQPRVFPCGHVFCERCIHRSVRWNTARCQQCDARHPAHAGAETFPKRRLVQEDDVKRQGVQKGDTNRFGVQNGGLSHPWVQKQTVEPETQVSGTYNWTKSQPNVSYPEIYKQNQASNQVQPRTAPNQPLNHSNYQAQPTITRQEVSGPDNLGLGEPIVLHQPRFSDRSRSPRNVPPRPSLPSGTNFTGNQPSGNKVLTSSTNNTGNIGSQPMGPNKGLGDGYGEFPYQSYQENPDSFEQRRMPDLQEEEEEENVYSNYPLGEIYPNNYGDPQFTDQKFRELPDSDFQNAGYAQKEYHKGDQLLEENHQSSYPPIDRSRGDNPSRNYPSRDYPSKGNPPSGHPHREPQHLGYPQREPQQLGHPTGGSPADFPQRNYLPAEYQQNDYISRDYPPHSYPQQGNPHMTYQQGEDLPRRYPSVDYLHRGNPGGSERGYPKQENLTREYPIQREIPFSGNPPRGVFPQGIQPHLNASHNQLSNQTDPNQHPRIPPNGSNQPFVVEHRSHNQNHPVYPENTNLNQQGVQGRYGNNLMEDIPRQQRFEHNQHTWPNTRVAYQNQKPGVTFDNMVKNGYENQDQDGPKISELDSSQEFEVSENYSFPADQSSPVYQQRPHAAQQSSKPMVKGNQVHPETYTPNQMRVQGYQPPVNQVHSAPNQGMVSEFQKPSDTSTPKGYQDQVPVPNYQTHPDSITPSFHAETNHPVNEPTVSPINSGQNITPRQGNEYTPNPMNQIYSNNNEQKANPKKKVQVSGNMVEVKVFSGQGQKMEKLKMFRSLDQEEIERGGKGGGNIPETGETQDLPNQAMQDMEGMKGVRAPTGSVDYPKMEPSRQQTVQQNVRTNPKLQETRGVDVPQRMRAQDRNQPIRFTENNSKQPIIPTTKEVNKPKQVLASVTSPKPARRNQPKNPEIISKLKGGSGSGYQELPENENQEEVEIHVIHKPRFSEDTLVNLSKRPLKVEMRKKQKPTAKNGYPGNLGLPGSKTIEEEPSMNQRLNDIQNIPLPRKTQSVAKQQPRSRDDYNLRAQGPPLAALDSSQQSEAWSDRVGVIRKPKKKAQPKNAPVKEDTNLENNRRIYPNNETRVPREGRAREEQGPRPGGRRDKSREKQAPTPRVPPWKGPASRYRCKVIWSIENNYDRVHSLCVLGERSLVVSGENYGWGRITEYNLRDGRKTTSLRMDGASHVTQLEHNGKPYLAISFSESRTIELHDTQDVRKTRHTYHTNPDEPGLICTSSPYTLLYTDNSRYLRPTEVTSLDCRTSRPTYKYTTHTQHRGITDMCCVRDGETPLLVTSYSRTQNEDGGLYAYNRRTDRLEWSVSGGLRGVELPLNPAGLCADGRGHLYTCDRANSAVHMFYTDGEYMGMLGIPRNWGNPQENPARNSQGRGNPRGDPRDFPLDDADFKPLFLRWSDSIPGIVVGHRGRDSMRISLIQVLP